MGSLRRNVLLGLASTLLAGMAFGSRPGWCDDDLTVHGKPAGDGVVTLQAEPTFISGSNLGQSVPISVTIKNRGTDQDATLEMVGLPGYNSRHVYHRPVHLTGGGAVTHVTLYPTFQYYANLAQVRLATSRGTRMTVVTSLNGYLGQMDSYSGDKGRLALISDRIGALSPTPEFRAKANTSNSNTPQFKKCYVRPENAPDRSIGYHSIKVLVAGEGAERLSPEQWHAIREWVTSGGSLILMGQKGWAQAGSGFAELSPMRVNKPAQIQVSYQNPVDGMISSLVTDRPLYSGIRDTLVNGMLSPGAVPVFGLYQSAPPLVTGRQVLPIFARRQVGAGCVLYSAFDFTDRVLRTNDLPQMWNTLANQAMPFDGYVNYSGEQMIQMPWASAAHQTTDAAQDPFHLALPPLNEVVYVFAAYFLLTVPLTFVVLKRTRRMNLAWASGPVLAVVFAGVLYLFSARLYLAPLSRRTAGNLYAAAGDHRARFVGVTEMFFPHAGSYDVTVPHSDSMEYNSGNENYWSSANEGASLETTDDGETVHTPELGVTNLAFRRLYHSQTIDWGEGLTANLHFTGSSDRRLLTGTITNHTPMTLHNVCIRLPYGNNGDVCASQIIDVLPPGEKTIAPAALRWASRPEGSSSHMGSSPTLTGTVDAVSMGPMVGQDVSGSGTVNVVVSLPAVSDEKDGGR